MIQVTRLAFVSMFLLSAYGSFAQGQDARQAKSDIDRLQGTWLADLEPGKQGRLELKGSDLLYVLVQAERETVIWDGNFAINEKARPKQMDWTPLRLANRNIPSSLAIYQLEGDLLLIIGDTEGPRPAAFFSGGGNQRPKTVVFRRTKGAEKPRKSPRNRQASLPVNE